jgi:hypothetical protein
MLSMREAFPAVRDFARAECAARRLRLLKIAVRMQETTSRNRLGFAFCCPEAGLFRRLVGLSPRPQAASPPITPSFPTDALPRSKPRRDKRDAANWIARSRRLGHCNKLG